MLPLLGAAIGGLSSILGARSASRAQSRATDQQMRLARETRDIQRADFEPYRASGGRALGAYNFEMGLGGRPADYRGFTATPGYAARVQGGINALEGASAAQGMSLSGATQKALTRFGQQEATAEYGTYLDRLLGLSGMGQASAANQAAAAGNYGAMGNEAIGARGNAQAAGAIGMGNALNDAIGTGVGLWTYQNRTWGQPQPPTAAPAYGGLRPQARPW